MHITRIGAAGSGPFGSASGYEPENPLDYPRLDHLFQVECDPRVNLFVGTNGCGKTSLLRAIDDLYYLAGPESYMERNPICGWLGLSEDWPVPHNPPPGAELQGPAGWLPEWFPLPDGRVPLVHFPATRVNLPIGRFPSSDPVDEEGFWSDWIAPWETSEYRIGVSEKPGGFWNNYPREPFGALFEIQDGVFFGRHVEDAFYKLAEVFQSYVPLRMEILMDAVTAGHACAQDICSEMMGNASPHPYTRNVEFLDPREADLTEMAGRQPRVRRRDVTLPAMGISTRVDPLGSPVYAGTLSSGTQNTLLWIWALALEMANHYGWEKGWKDQPAILLIDEIENHLHPTWQRRVIPTLLEHFPALQIFATTHSPYVVAGLKAGQVHRMFRDPMADAPRFRMGDNQIEVETNEEDIVGWTSDEISRGYLEVMDPTDMATAMAAEELRRLREEGPWADDEQEQQRQERMLELRRIVNSDVLEGGPRAADEKLFEEEFTAAIRRYRESRNLN